MKKTLIVLVTLCAVIAGAIIFLNKQKAATPVSTPVAESASELTEPAPASSKAELADTIPATSSEPTKITATRSGAVVAKADDSANLIHKAVDALLSSKNAEEKRAVFRQLAKDGQLDAAMAELKQRMADDPNNAQLPTTLGEAQLNKLRALKESGNGDQNDFGILAMQADQSFNAALKIDPQNWEANFVKASSMYYWPPDEKRDNDVVQRLSGLIDQQETMTPNPAFVQTYVVLGNQYEKMGQLDKAMATWQLGAQKFPNDPVLQKKINGK